MFTVTTTIPATATVSNATINMNVQSNPLETNEFLRVYVENAASATNFYSLATHVPTWEYQGTTSLYPGTADTGVRWPTSGTFSGTGVLTSPSIASLIQYLLTTYGELTAGDEINVWVAGDATWITSEVDEINVESVYSTGTLEAELAITWSIGGGTPFRPGWLPQTM